LTDQVSYPYETGKIVDKGKEEMGRGMTIGQRKEIWEKGTKERKKEAH
jgi:hypothetical protein